MTAIDLDTSPRKIVMARAADLDNALPSGLDLVRQICEDALKGIARRQLQTQGALSGEDIKGVKDLASTIVDAEKAERDRKRADKFNGRLDGMTEEELWKIVNSK